MITIAIQVLSPTVEQDSSESHTNIVRLQVISTVTIQDVINYLCVKVPGMHWSLSDGFRALPGSKTLEELDIVQGQELYLRSEPLHFASATTSEEDEPETHNVRTFPRVLYPLLCAASALGAYPLHIGVDLSISSWITLAASVVCILVLSLYTYQNPQVAFILVPLGFSLASQLNLTVACIITALACWCIPLLWHGLTILSLFSLLGSIPSIGMVLAVSTLLLSESVAVKLMGKIPYIPAGKPPLSRLSTTPSGNSCNWSIRALLSTPDTSAEKNMYFHRLIQLTSSFALPIFSAFLLHSPSRNHSFHSAPSLFVSGVIIILICESLRKDTRSLWIYCSCITILEALVTQYLFASTHSHYSIIALAVITVLAFTYDKTFSPPEKLIRGIQIPLLICLIPTALYLTGVFDLARSIQF